MPGQQQADLSGPGQVTQLGQAAQVITEVPVARDDPWLLTRDVSLVSRWPRAFIARNTGSSAA